MLAWLFDQPTPERHDPPAAALRCIQPRKTVGPHASLSSSVLRRLVRQDKDLEVHGGVTAAELGEELDGAAQDQVGRSWQHRGASAVGAAETPRWQAESMRTPAHGPCLNICTLRVQAVKARDEATLDRIAAEVAELATQFPAPGISLDSL